MLTILILLSGSSSFAEGLSFSSFQYITIFEETIFGEHITFGNGDTLYGWVHSNDNIYTLGGLFYGMVSTSDSIVGSGQFFGPGPFENYPEADFPTELTELRAVSQTMNTYLCLPDTQYRVQFRGNDGVRIYGWQEGEPFNDSTAAIIYNEPPDGVFFLDGPMEITGVEVDAGGNHHDHGISGRYTIGSSHDIYVVDNLRYVDSDRFTGAIDSLSVHMLGLSSEGNILVANTIENGKDNGGGLYPNDIWRSSVIINGALLALNESFSFEDQNDDTTTYGGQLPGWYYSQGTTPDERGTIYFWGSLAQYRRGYVHRSNNGGTGYIKDYHSYYALATDPPYFPTTPQGLEFSSMNLDFGEVYIEADSTITVDISLFGMGYVTIEDWSYSDPVFSGAPDTLIFDPFNAGTIGVAFTPEEGIEYDAVLTLETTSGDYIIQLYGTGVPLSAGGEDIVNSVNDFKIVSAYPNPFNGSVTITFSVPNEEAAVITIFDIEGRVVFDMSMNCISGLNGFNWQPEMESSGLYFYKIEGGNGFVNGKLLYLK